MQSHHEEADLLQLVEKKCQDLKITTYESEYKVNQDHYGVRLIGCMIAHYESQISFKRRIIREYINSSSEQKDSTEHPSGLDLSQSNERQNVLTENQSNMQQHTTQQTGNEQEPTILAIVKHQCQKLKVSMDESYDNFNVEQKPLHAIAGLIAYYEASIAFLDQTTKQIIDGEKTEDGKIEGSQDLKKDESKPQTQPKVNQQKEEKNLQDTQPQHEQTHDQKIENEEKEQEAAQSQTISSPLQPESDHIGQKQEEKQPILEAQKVQQIQQTQLTQQAQNTEGVLLSNEVWNSLTDSLKKRKEKLNLSQTITRLNIHQAWNQLIQSYEASIKVSHSQLSYLQQQHSEVQFQHGKLQQQLQQALLQNQKISSLQTEIQTLNEKIQGEEQRHKEIQSELQKTVNSLRDELQLTKKGFEDAEQKLKEENLREVGLLKEENGKLQDQVKSMTSEIELMQSKLQDIEGRHNSATNELEQLKSSSDSQIASLKSEIKKFQQQKSAIQEKLQQLSQNHLAQIESLKSDLNNKDTHNQQLQKLQQQNNVLSQQTVKLREQNSQQQQKLEELQKKIQIQEFVVKKNQEQKHEKEKQVQDLQQQLTSLREEKQRLKEQLQNINKELETKLKSTKDSLEAIQSKYDHAKESLRQIRSALWQAKSNEMDFNKIKPEITALKEREAHSLEQIKRLEGEIKNEKQENQRLNDSLKDKEEKLSELVVRGDSQAEEISDLNERIDQQVAKLKDLQVQLAQTQQGQNHNQQSELQSLTSHLSQVRQELEKQRKRGQDLQTQLMQQKQHNQSHMQQSLHYQRDIQKIQQEKQKVANQLEKELREKKQIEHRLGQVERNLEIRDRQMAELKGKVDEKQKAYDDLKGSFDQMKYMLESRREIPHQEAKQQQQESKQEQPQPQLHLTTSQSLPSDALNPSSLLSSMNITRTISQYVPLQNTHLNTTHQTSEQLQSKIHSLQEQIESLQKQVGELRKEMEGLGEENRRLKQELEIKEGDVRFLRKEIEDKEEIIRQKSPDVSLVGTGQQGSDDSIIDLSTYKAMQEQLKMAKTQLLIYKKLNSQNEQKLKQLTDQHPEQPKQPSPQSQQLPQLSTKLHQTQQQLQASHLKIEQLQKALQHAQKQRLSLVDTHTAKETQLRNRFTQQDNSRNDLINSLNEIIKKKEQQLHDKAEELSRLDRLVIESESKCIHLQEQLKIMQQQQNDNRLSKDQASQFKEKILQLQNENKALIDRLQELEKNPPIVEKQVSQHVTPVLAVPVADEQNQQSIEEKLKQQINALELEVSDIKSKNVRLEDEIKELTNLRSSEDQAFRITQRSLEQQLQLIHKEVANLKEEKVKLQQRNVSLEKVQSQRKVLEDNHNLLTKEHQTLSTELNQTKQKLRLLTQQNLAMKGEGQNLLQQNTQIKETLTEFNTLKTKNQQNTRLVEELTQQVSKIDATVDFLNERVEKLKKEKKDIQEKFQSRVKEVETQLKPVKEELASQKSVNSKARVLTESYQQLINKYILNVDQQVKYSTELQESAQKAASSSLVKQQEYKKDQQRIKNLKAELDKAENDHKALFPKGQPEQEMDVEEQIMSEERIKKHVEDKFETMGFYEQKFLYFWMKTEEQEELLKIAEAERKQLQEHKVKNQQQAEKIIQLESTISGLEFRVAEFEALQKLMAQRQHDNKQLNITLQQTTTKLTSLSNELSEQKKLYAQEQQKLKSTRDKLNKQIQQMAQLIEEKKQIETQLPLLQIKNKTLEEENTQLKLNDKGREKLFNQKMDRILKDFKADTENQIKSSNAQIRQKAYKDFNKLQSNLKKQSSYVDSMHALLKKVFQKCTDQHKPKLQTKSIDEFISAIIEYLQNPQRKFNFGDDFLTKAQKRNENIFERIAKYNK